MLVWAQVMAYRTDAFKGAVPKGWADFWNTKKFPGDRAMVGAGSGNNPELEFALLAAGVPADKLYPLDLDKAFASFDKIKGDVVKWWETGTRPLPHPGPGTGAPAGCVEDRNRHAGRGRILLAHGPWVGTSSRLP